MVNLIAGIDIRNDAQFSGNSYLEFSRSMLPHLRENEQETIALELSTNSSEGLIFWHGQTSNEDGQGQDYIYLAGNSKLIFKTAVSNPMCNCQLSMVTLSLVTTLALDQR